MFAQHERIKMIDSAPAEGYRHYCPCSTRSLRPCLGPVSNVTCLCGAQPGGDSPHLTEVAGICAQQNRLIVLPSATFAVQNPESSDGMMHRKCQNKGANHENEITVMERFSCRGLQSSSIARGVLEEMNVDKL